jgi:trehalose 6-phosphate phosphatase
LLDDAMGAAVSALAERCPVAVVSGRDLAMLRKLVAIDSLYYAGSHGFEIAGPKGQVTSMERGVEYLPLLDEAEQALRRKLAEIAGHSVERKRFSVAVHYRQVASGPGRGPQGHRRRRVGTAAATAGRPRQKGAGNPSRPGLEQGRSGDCGCWSNCSLTGPMSCRSTWVMTSPTNTPSECLAEGGLTIVVRGEDQRPTAADYAVADTEEVRGFLAWLTGILGEPTVSGEVADDSP